MADNNGIDIHEFIKLHLDLLPVSCVLLPQESDVRASKFLLAKAQLAKYKLDLTNQLIHANSKMDLSFKLALDQAEGKNVTEKKVIAQANPEYITSREWCELVDSNLKYVSSIIEVFQDGHIHLRQMSKGLSNG